MNSARAKLRQSHKKPPPPPFARICRIGLMKYYPVERFILGPAEGGGSTICRGCLGGGGCRDCRCENVAVFRVTDGVSLMLHVEGAAVATKFSSVSTEGWGWWRESGIEKEDGDRRAKRVFEGGCGRYKGGGCGVGVVEDIRVGGGSDV